MIYLCCIYFSVLIISFIFVLTGSYCIYKSGTCPKSMRSGWVIWDDEDYKNKNSIGGFLPDGSYDKDTKIEYCCQHEGHWYDSIELPVSQPFYLLTYPALLTLLNVRW